MYFGRSGPTLQKILGNFGNNEKGLLMIREMPKTFRDSRLLLLAEFLESWIGGQSATQSFAAVHMML
jgi:hypothetical protein